MKLIKIEEKSTSNVRKPIIALTVEGTYIYVAHTTMQDGNDVLTDFPHSGGM
jgi:hypothetical protein